MAFTTPSSVLTRKRASDQTISYSGFPLGLNKSAGDKQLELGELSEALNIKYTDDGRIVTRSGIEKATYTGTDDDAAITFIANGLVDQEGYKYDTVKYDTITYGGGDETALRHHVVVADENHKIYYLDNGNLNPIGTAYTAEGDVFLASFGGYVMVCDGEYLKYWDGTSFKICYDYGTGTSGYQFDNTTLTNDTSYSLYTSFPSYAGSFTTQVWSSGFTIPILGADVVLSKTGSPTGSLVAKLYDSSLVTVHATSSNFDVSNLTTSAVNTTLSFDPDNTYAMVPDTDYYLALEYSDGDSSNHVNVHINTVSSGGLGAYYSGSAWTTVGTQTPLMAVQPGRPPKASSGVVWQNRFWFLDPDNPGWARFTNANSIFDFSTTDGGGWIGAVNDNSTNFPIGSIIPHYGVLYIIGRHEAPFISKITGTEPTDFEQTILLQAISGGPNTVVSTINDVWIENDTNVYSMSGVQEYGDIRTNTPGSPIQSIIRQYHDSSAKAAFNPIDGQVWIKLNGYDRVLVGHTRRGVKSGAMVRFPWTEYEFKEITPTAFGFSVDKFYIGGDDGHLYTLTTDVLDGSTQPDYNLKTCISESPYGQSLIKEVYLSLNSDAAATMNLNFYRNGGTTSLLTKALSAQSDRILQRVQFSCRSLQWELATVVITKPLNIGDVLIKAMPLEV